LNAGRAVTLRAAKAEWLATMQVIAARQD